MTAHRSPSRRSPSRRSPLRGAAVVAAAATAALVLTSCGSGDGSSAGDGQGGHNGHAEKGSPSAPASPGKHNKADVSFAQAMIPHHRQAVEMSELAATRADSAKVEKLAREIKKAQDPEIRTLSGWLTTWGEKVPRPGDSSGHAGHSMPGMSEASGPSGMMSEQEMKDLRKASGREFDTAFLTLMVKHHEGAVAMAETEQKNGAYRPAKKMADAIITSQTAEIDEMNKLLGTD